MNILIRKKIKKNSIRASFKAAISRDDFAKEEAFPEDYKIMDDNSMAKNSLHESPLEIRKNIILESTENIQTYTKLSQDNPVSLDMSNVQSHCNIQSFDKKNEDTEYTLKKEPRVDSLDITPLKFSAEMLTFEKINKNLKTSIDHDNPFKVATLRSTSAECLHASSPRITIAEVNPPKKYNSRIMRAHSADLVLCWRYDSLNSMNFFEGIKHKSSTDLPVFLQYNNLEEDNGENQPEAQNDPVEDHIHMKDFKLFSPDKPLEEGDSEDETPCFNMKSVLNKFSSIKNGLDRSSTSRDNEEVKERELGTILEQQTEEEVTECNPSFAASEESYTTNLEERHSNLYSMNMRGLQSRTKEIKNKFTHDASLFPVIEEENEIPEENEASISNSRALNFPDLAFNQKESMISSSQFKVSSRAGSECYCCVINS
ncbi:unnamed protein product [Moneuplotes crassus]|uniref:Uncharacterized protein n=1 Tax=Euplotes crassus TaxID=5936 RepID=A0AAD1Y5G0_EUPCR|nr:unnamed protein product [Moneuplotes crassus]